VCGHGGRTLIRSSHSSRDPGQRGTLFSTSSVHIGASHGL
jgi:hypothetical protein